MLHLITTLLFLLQATTRAQLVFKRQVFGFDSAGRQLQANIDISNEDNSQEFLNQGTILFLLTAVTHCVDWFCYDGRFPYLIKPDIVESYQRLTKK